MPLPSGYELNWRRREREYSFPFPAKLKLPCAKGDDVVKRSQKPQRQDGGCFRLMP